MNNHQKKDETSPLPEPVKVDLVVIMDTSDSMLDEAVALSAAVKRAIDTVSVSCPSDLRVLSLGIEGTWPDTQFSESYRAYLSRIGVSDEVILGAPLGTLLHQGAQEEGAAAVVDIAYHFDWRPGAARYIFYIGDEALKGGNPQTEADVVAANRAITAARDKAVTVFTYCGTKVASQSEADHAVTKAEYARLAAETGGQTFAAPLTTISQFQTVLAEIVCAGGGYNDAKIPKVRPCLALHWGDGPRDQIETTDYEIIHLVVSNPYSNVIFKDVTIELAVLTFEGKEIPTLPDETPSVWIKPSGPICFGDLLPCDPKKVCPASSAAREVVLLSRGARPGTYYLSINYRFSEKLVVYGTEQFALSLVAS